MSAGHASRRHRALAAALAPLLALGLAACGGEGDDPGIEAADVAGIAADIPEFTAGQVSEEVFAEHPWPPVTEAGLDSGWKGQYLAQYTDIAPGVERMSVTVDVYGTESKAKKRADAQQQLTADFVSSLATRVEAITVTAGPDCLAFSIKSSFIVPQYEVYCQAGTAVIYVRTIGRDEPAAIALASSLASDLTQAVAAAIAARS